MSRKTSIFILSICLLILSMVISSIPIAFQDPAATKLSISPDSITGPPPDVGESFNINITIENVIDLTGFQIGLKWDPNVLQCNSFTPQFGTGTFLGPSSDWLGVAGTINNIIMDLQNTTFLNITNPLTNTSRWHELSPVYCQNHTLTSWTDTDSSGSLTVGDKVEFQDFPGVLWNVDTLEYGAITNMTVSTGEIYPPYAYTFLGIYVGIPPPNGSGTIAQVSFTVLDYGSTWINLTWVSIEASIRNFIVSIPVNVINGTFKRTLPAAPVANFDYSPSDPDVGDEVTFDASASVLGWNGTVNVPIANYTWDFGDGTPTVTETDPITTHTYAANDTYTVSLTITCEEDPRLINWTLTSDSTSKSITITAIPVVLVHDVAVTSVTPSPTEVTEGDSVTITVIVKNEGDYTESFNVTAYYDNTAIDTKVVTNLASGATKTLTFTWDTTDVDKDDYKIKAVAETVAGETDVDDNTLIDGTVKVKAPAPEMPWLLIILVIIVIVAIIIIVYWLIRRKKTK